LAELQIHFQIEQIKNASATQNLIFTAPTSVHKVLAPHMKLRNVKGPGIDFVLIALENV